MPSDSPREYILELYRGPTTLVDAFALPLVSSYERRPIPALSREWTAAKRPVKQSAGYREEEIRITGVSGLRPAGVFTVTANNTLASTQLDGVAYFERLLAFLKAYEDDAAINRSVWKQDAALAPNMVFRDLSGGGAWYVDDIQIVASSRVGSSRNTYEYTLSMKTEGEAKVQRYQVLANTPTKSIPLSETATTANLTNAVRLTDPNRSPLSPQTATEASPLSFTSVSNLLRDLPAEMQFYDPPVRQWLAQADQFGTIATTALAAGLGIPRDAARNFRSYCETTARQIYKLWDATSQPLRDPARNILDQFRAAIDAVTLSVTTLLGMAGSKLGAPDQPLTLPSGNTSAGAQAVTVQRVTVGEDLQAFAARVLGPLKRWTEIMALNGMSSPWAMGDGSPLIPGTPLLVPQDVPDLERSPDGDPFDLYGTDLLWDFTAMDFVTQGTAPTDFLAVTGSANLKQGLLTRFSTARGAVLVRPNMGLPNTLGQIATPQAAALKASQVVSQAGADPRIRKVAGVSFAQAANVQVANIELVPVTNEGFSVAVPVG